MSATKTAEMEQRSRLVLLLETTSLRTLYFKVL